MPILFETAWRLMPPCSPASRSSARNPRHARFAHAKLRVAPGCCALPLTPAARGGLLEGSGRGASRPSLRSDVRLASGGSNQGLNKCEGRAQKGGLTTVRDVPAVRSPLSALRKASGGSSRLLRPARPRPLRLLALVRIEQRLAQPD